VQEILVFRATCKISKDLLEPDKYNMVTFSEAIYPNKDIYLAWIDFTVYFQHKNLSELKKMFNIAPNRYLILTSMQEMISLENDNFYYPEKIFFKKHPNVFQSDKNHAGAFKPVSMFTPKVWNKRKTAWAQITDDGNVQTGGCRDDGGDTGHLQHKLKNVKKIFPSGRAFVASLSDDTIVAWGNYNCRNAIQSSKVKMIFSNLGAFVALLDDNTVTTWGDQNFCGRIPYPIQSQRVKMVFSTWCAFAAILFDDTVVSWGDKDWGGQIPDEIQSQKVKMIFSNYRAFAALLFNDTVIAWNKKNYGGKIPNSIRSRKVKMIFSSGYAFAALLFDDTVIAWGVKGFGGQIPDALENKYVQTIMPREGGFTAQCKDGQKIKWGKN